MKVISISDMTIKEAAGSADMALTFKEQMAIARALDSLGVDVIELPAADSKSGALLVKALSPVINKATISVEAGLSIEEVKAAVEAGYKSVSLGSARLRTETAALSAVMMMQLAFRK